MAGAVTRPINSEPISQLPMEGLRVIRAMVTALREIGEGRVAR